MKLEDSNLTQHKHGDFAGRWVSDREYSRLTGISRQCLANWRWQDTKAGGVRPGYPLWRKFGADTVRYWVGPELIPDGDLRPQPGPEGRDERG
jgi:hypothetical protein